MFTLLYNHEFNCITLHTNSKDYIYKERVINTIVNNCKESEVKYIYNTKGRLILRNVNLHKFTELNNNLSIVELNRTEKICKDGNEVTNLKVSII